MDKTSTYLPYVGKNYHLGLKGFDSDGKMIPGSENDPGFKFAILVNGLIQLPTVVDRSTFIKSEMEKQISKPNLFWESICKALTGEFDTVDTSILDYVAVIPISQYRLSPIYPTPDKKRISDSKYTTKKFLTELNPNKALAMCSKYIFEVLRSNPFKVHPFSGEAVILRKLHTSTAEIDTIRAYNMRLRPSEVHELIKSLFYDSNTTSNY